MSSRRAVAVMYLLLGLAGGGAAQAKSGETPEICNSSVDLDGTSDLPKGVSIEATKKNTLVFNHLKLRADGDHPFVLEADDGGHFQVLFTCTAAEYFDYTITADDSTVPDRASAITQPEWVSVAPESLGTRGVTMRHSSSFLRYRVSAKVREGVQVSTTRPGPPDGRHEDYPGDRKPQVRIISPGGENLAKLTQDLAKIADVVPPTVSLYSMSFDIWVVTAPGWKLGIIGGVAGSKLTDTKYSIATDQDGSKAFQEDATQDSGHTDVIALANVYYSKTFWRTVNFGMAFGLGTSGTSPRYFIGPSVVVGKHFVLTAGRAFGWVDAPPLGQELGKPPVNGDNTLNSLSKRFTNAWYFGIGFTWIDRTDQFAAALTAASSASGAVGSCVTSVKPDAVSFDEKGKAVDKENKEVVIVVEAGADCFWTATLQMTGTGFTVTDGVGKGKGSVKVSTGSWVEGGRSDILNITGPSGSAAKSVKLTQAPRPRSCVTSVSTDFLDFEKKTENKSVGVKSESDCQWKATVDPADLFKIDPMGGKGDGMIVVTPPAAGVNQIRAKLSVVGPEGAAPKTVDLKQPEK